MIANGTEGATVRIDAYSTTDNSSLTYRILNGSVPLLYDQYISVMGDQLVIESVPEGLLPRTFFIDVCRICMIVLQGRVEMAGACLLILCSDLSHRKLSFTCTTTSFFFTLHHAKSIQLGGWQKLGSR